MLQEIMYAPGGTVGWGWGAFFCQKNFHWMPGLQLVWIPLIFCCLLSNKNANDTIFYSSSMLSICRDSKLLLLPLLFGQQKSFAQLQLPLRVAFSLFHDSPSGFGTSLGHRFPKLQVCTSPFAQRNVFIMKNVKYPPKVLFGP